MVSAQPNFEYQYGGSLPADAPTYVTREADETLYAALKQSEFSYVLNSRQMGKSSLRARVQKRLEAEGIVCAFIDITSLGSSNVDEATWYADLIDTLAGELDLEEKCDFDIDQFLDSVEKLSPVRWFSKFIEDILLTQIPEQIVVFIDEIDSTINLNFSTDDFFALIRAFYNQRVNNPEYNKITFCLLGVATPGDLIEDKTRTPFNIGTAINLSGFTLSEAQPLVAGLQGKATDGEAVLNAILGWTGGQPFLTQKLCRLVMDAAGEILAGTEGVWVDSLVQRKILDHWESQDEPEHLRTIQNRLFSRDEKVTGRLLGIYQQVISTPPLTRKAEVESPPGDGTTDVIASSIEQLAQSISRSEEMSEKHIPNLTSEVREQENDFLSIDLEEEMALRLTGLVKKNGGQLIISNQIYLKIFDERWIEASLNKLRPYSEAISQWLASGDESYLLKGNALEDALTWAANKSLSPQDYQFFNASREFKEKELVEANVILAEAQQKARNTIRKGLALLILGAVSLSGTLVYSGGVLRSARQAKSDLTAMELAAEKAKEESKIAWEQTQQAQENLTQANQEVTIAQQNVIKAEQALQAAEQETLDQENKAKSRLAETKKQLTTAEIKQKEAASQADKAKIQLGTFQQEFNLIEQELVTERTVLERTKREAEENLNKIASQLTLLEQKEKQARENLDSIIQQISA
ncbi:WD-40 repeat-containing protein [[Leptolyngbya] sp. PCC 7376]|uniref:AAA-like domain-containing protein n=1 Tax=[Leptolyngbya] sp. PCC 7376 TaxID=111781 RepID=UPI00029F303E|nr:AAA-like domain-containing protein [[Leptolyngbya] sp. PCC 7376]AFY38121.1 WD-40 repeat-containing protein [[Leptolyngbya] sp. PCC 7376]